ncbi:anthranilate synthase component I family protein [Heliorestis convoluta]|nr:anthranilate synthase component I family protein [Heliorestis convoluta]
MMSRAIYPSCSAFQEMRQNHPHEGIPLVVTIKRPEKITVPATFNHFCPQGTIGILLESSRHNEQSGRYSLIALNPYQEFRAKGSTISIRKNQERRALRPRPALPFGQASGEQTEEADKPLERLRQEYLQSPIYAWPGRPKFCGGIVGGLSYDMGRHFERLPDQTIDDLDLPDLLFYWVDDAILFDHLEDTVTIVALQWPRETYEITAKRLQDYVDQLDFIKPLPEGKWTDKKKAYEETISVKPNVSAQQFTEMVKSCQEYIRAGDIFQANLSVRLETDVTAHAWSVYQILRQINPSPYSCYLDFGDWQVVSSSPELLVRLQEGLAETRPIAGTRKRGKTSIEDEAMAEELLHNEKEEAEHVMLVDLERNDLGRLCQFGTVEVNQFKVIEYYSHVMHLVSNVRGILRPDQDVFDLIQATFPGGTITGAPKIRSMEIIEELEPTKRSFYTGSIGFIGFDGTMELNIVIRTLLFKAGLAYVQAGAGIVADSLPEREYKESLRKAEALLRAVEIAEEKQP